jgi:class 3 adenylate cyclase
MLDPWLYNCVAEMITRAMKPDQIDEAGCLLMKHYCSHTLLGIDKHITVSTRKAAAALLNECIEKGYEERLLKFLVEIDGNPLLGKVVQLDGIEELLSAMARSGYIYDEKKRKIRVLKEDIRELTGWGALKVGRYYDITVVSIDIAGSSAIVKKHGMKKAERLYFHFWSFLRRILAVYDGRIWNWAGDGGIIAFTFKGHQKRALMFALELQSLMELFNSDPDRPVNEAIRLRMGLDWGKIKYLSDTGQIVSETINYAAHLEKGFTSPGGISASAELITAVPGSLKAMFRSGGTFEGRKAWRCIREERQGIDEPDDTRRRA